MKDETGKIVFDEDEQKEVDRIIGERLARAKAEKPEDYDDLKEIAEALTAWDYYTGTPAEIKERLKEQAAEVRKQKELEKLKDEAADYGSGNVPVELLKEIKDLKAELDGIKKEKDEKTKAEQAQAAAQENWNKQVKEFQGKYADIDLDKLGQNEKFRKFYEKSSYTLLEAYEEYADLVGGAEKEAIAKVKSNLDRSTSSGKSGGDVGGTHGLNAKQMALAEENGISYKDYADMLKMIKK